MRDALNQGVGNRIGEWRNRKNRAPRMMYEICKRAMVEANDVLRQVEDGLGDKRGRVPEITEMRDAVNQSKQERNDQAHNRSRPCSQNDVVKHTKEPWLLSQ